MAMPAPLRDGDGDAMAMAMPWRCDAWRWRCDGDDMRGDALDVCDATRGDATRIQTMRDIHTDPGISPRPCII